MTTEATTSSTVTTVSDATTIHSDTLCFLYTYYSPTGLHHANKNPEPRNSYKGPRNHSHTVTQLLTSVPPLSCPASEYTGATYPPSGILSTSHSGPYSQ
jgi:hypothetical protein